MPKNTEFDRLLDSLMTKLSLLDVPPNTLISVPVQQAKIKEEFKRKAQGLNMGLKLRPAFRLLKRRACQNYMSLQEYEEMSDQLSKIASYFEGIDLAQPLENKLKSELHISDSTMSAIYKMAVAKYNEQDYASCLSLFSLLASLDSENEDYWYRLGIVASQTEKLEFALQSFARALYYNQELLAPRIFSAECYLKLNQVDNAKLEIEEARKSIGRNGAPDAVWMDLIAAIEDKTKAPL